MISLEPGSAPQEKPPLLKRASDLVRKLYRDEWAMWNAHYKRYFGIAAWALALGFIIGFVYFAIRPEQEKKAFDYFMSSLGDIPLGASPLVLALTLFYHNARAAAAAAAVGIIPFARLSILYPLANGAALGLVASISKRQGLNVPLLFIKIVAPHGIFELPAFLYATSVGLYLSVSLGKKALAARRKKKEDRAPLTPAPTGASGGFLESYPERAEADRGTLWADVFQSFLLVILPLLLIAAFIEGFITPLLI